MKIANASLVAQILGCTVDQARRQYACNANQLNAMAKQAQKTGRKVNGYTAAQLERRAMAARENAQEEGPENQPWSGHSHGPQSARSWIVKNEARPQGNQNWKGKREPESD